MNQKNDNTSNPAKMNKNNSNLGSLDFFSSGPVTSKQEKINFNNINVLTQKLNMLNVNNTSSISNDVFSFNDPAKSSNSINNNIHNINHNNYLGDLLLILITIILTLTITALKIIMKKMMMNLMRFKKIILSLSNRKSQDYLLY